MRLAGLLTGGEARTLLWRGGGIVIAAITSLLSVRIFLALDPAGAPGLFALVGWLAFLPLMQWGFGRPVYSALREGHARGGVGWPVLRDALGRFAAFAALAVATLSLFGPWVAMRLGHPGPALSLATLACGLAALGSGAFQRDVAYAVSFEEAYERVEVLRKLAALAGYGALAWQVPMAVVGASWLAFGAASQVWLARRLRGAAAASAPPGGDASRADAGQFFLFSANELLLYNLPLVAYSWLEGRTELVYFAVWNRLWQLVVLPMRMFVDARVNRQASAYFQGRGHDLRRELTASLAFAVIAVAVAWVLTALSKQTLLRWIGAAELAQDPWFLAALLLWSAGNAVQHVFGSFVLSYGGGFSFALRASLASTLVLALLLALLYRSGAPIGLQLSVLGLAYCGFSLLYARHARACSRVSLAST